MKFKLVGLILGLVGMVGMVGCAGHPVNTQPFSQKTAQYATTFLTATESVQGIVVGANTTGTLKDVPAMKIMALSYHIGDSAQKLSVILRRFDTLSKEAQATALEQQPILGLVADIEKGFTDVSKVTIPDSIVNDVRSAITTAFETVAKVKALLAALRPTPSALQILWRSMPTFADLRTHMHVSQIMGGVR